MGPLVWLALGTKSEFLGPSGVSHIASKRCPGKPARVGPYRDKLLEGSWELSGSHLGGPQTQNGHPGGPKMRPDMDPEVLHGGCDPPCNTGGRPKAPNLPGQEPQRHPKKDPEISSEGWK